MTGVAELGIEGGMAEEGRVSVGLGRARPATTPANGDNAHAPSDLDPFPHPISKGIEFDGFKTER